MAETSVPMLEKFNGAMGQDAKGWFENFERVAKVKNWSDETANNALPLYLRDIAETWYRLLPAADKNTMAKTKTAFTERFKLSAQQKQDKLGQLFAMKQLSGEKAEAFVNRIVRFSLDLTIDDTALRAAIIGGLEQSVQHQVKLNQPDSVDEIIRLATLAEDVKPTPDTSTAALLQLIQNMDKRMTETQEKTQQQVAALLETHQVAAVQAAEYHRPGGRHSQQRRTPQNMQQGNYGNHGYGPRQNNESISCHVCGSLGHYANNCRNRNKQCYKCGRIGHISSACASTPFGGSTQIRP